VLADRSAGDADSRRSLWRNHRLSDGRLSSGADRVLGAVIAVSAALALAR
jgi:hypothetical protein